MEIGVDVMDVLKRRMREVAGPGMHVTTGRVEIERSGIPVPDIAVGHQGGCPVPDRVVGDLDTRAIMADGLGGIRHPAVMAH